MNNRDIGSGVMMPPASMHTPKEWQNMLVVEQKRVIVELQQKLEQAEAQLALVYKSLEVRDAELEDVNDLIKWIYCKEIGSDSIIGLDSCYNFRDWLMAQSLLDNAKGDE